MAPLPLIHDAPSGPELDSILAQAVTIARAAGERAREAFLGTVKLEFKGSRQDDPVTATDRDIETYLRVELGAAFPGHGIVGEEQADQLEAEPPLVWVLDPLDGTANFAAGLPLWGVSVALLHRGTPLVGCIWTPTSPLLTAGVFHARRGGGAWFDDREIRAGSGEDLRGRVLALPSQYWRRIRFQRPRDGTPRTRWAMADPRSLGSITYELVLAAMGVLQAATFLQPKIWDVAAGVLIAQEAGAKAMEWRERRWQAFEGYVPMAPSKGAGAPAFRHWSSPLVVGTPTIVDIMVQRLAWQPRLPGPLRRALGLSDGD